MKLWLKVVVVLALMWPILELGDGIMTQYKAIVTGREMCDRFLNGFDPETDQVSGHFRIMEMFRTPLNWDAARPEEEGLFETCQFQFKWRWRDGPFYGAIHIWLTKQNEDGSTATIWTGAHVNYHYFLNYINLTGVVADDRAIRREYNHGLTMWEETYRRGALLP